MKPVSSLIQVVASALTFAAKRSYILICGALLLAAPFDGEYFSVAGTSHCLRMLGVGAAAAEELKIEAAVAKPSASPKPQPNGTPHKGWFFGSVASVGEELDFVYLLPLGHGEHRRMFYLDRKTKYSLDSEESEAKALHTGQKAAVHFLSDGEAALADEIAVVTGELDPQIFLNRKKKKGKAASKVIKHEKGTAAEKKSEE